MKKIYSCLIAVCIFAMLLVPFTASATSKNVDILDLVRLKKYLVGTRTTIQNADYNEDGAVNALDLVTLRKLVFEMPDNTVNYPEFDNEGYYNQVVKP